MKTTILTYRTIIQKDGKNYHGYVPVLHGCHTQGATIEETQKNLREAITGYLMSMKKHRKAGYIHDHTEGSHHIFYHPVKKLRVSVPMHQGRDLGQGITLALIKDAKLTRDEFLRLL